VLLLAGLAGVLAGVAWAGKYVGEFLADMKALRSDMKTFRSDMKTLNTQFQTQFREMNNPLDMNSLRNGVVRTDRRVAQLAKTWCRMAEALHPNDLSTVRKYCLDYEYTTAAYMPLNSPVKVPAFLEKSEVVTGMWRFRKPDASEGEHFQVEPFLPGTIDSVTSERDGTYTLVMSHGGGFRSKYMNLRDIPKSFGVKTGAYVADSRPIGEGIATSPFCLRVGLFDPDGNLIDPTPFFKHPPKPQLKDSKGKPARP
jgi:hypothetical protein